MNSILSSRRLLLEVPLAPVQGDRFQPTGFADIGAATYTAPTGTQMLLLESAQSVANRLEASILGPDQLLCPELQGLSYIRVRLTGASSTVTTSLTEAHRLNSPFIISDEGFRQKLVEASGYAKGRPIDWRKIARAFYMYDVNALLHGAFLANLEDGRVRLARAITGFIEARDIREAVSGGVKNNAFDPSGTIRAANYDKDVYGNVPYHRVEYTAGSITAYFNLDVGLLRGYALGDEALDLLVSLALLKVRRFLDGGLRLRTACDLKSLAEPKVIEPAGFVLPSESELLAAVQAGIVASRAMFASPAVTELVTATTESKKAKKETEE